MHRFKKVITKIDPSKFLPLKGNLEEMFRTATWNLWRQFGVTERKAKIFKEKGRPIHVTDYAWTKEASEEFKRYHAQFFEKLEGESETGWSLQSEWILNVEPANYGFNKEKTSRS